MKIQKLGLAAAVLFLSTTSNAALVGNGIYTLDTATGYTWLDVTETTNCSYSVMSTGGMCNGTDLSVWNFATQTDVYELWGNAGISIENSTTYTVANTSEIDNLMDLVGITVINTNTFYGVNGYVSSSTDQILQLFVKDGTSRDYAFTLLNSPYSVVGGWFYRTDISNVPVPAAAWLFGSGLLGLIAVARRKKV